jgi:hypothetical protein
MRLKTILLGAALAGVTLVASSNLVQAQVCRQNEVISPSKQTRVFRQERFNYSFRLPDNYRVMALRDNGALVLDPNSFETAQCFVRNKVGTEFPEGISVYLKSVNPGNRSVTDIVRQNLLPVENIKTTTVANQAAISYNMSAMGYQKSVSFFSPDRRSMITITVPYKFETNARGERVPSRIFNEGVFNTVVSSFTFIRR